MMRTHGKHTTQGPAATYSSGLQVTKPAPGEKETSPENVSSGSCHAEREAEKPNARFCFARQLSSKPQGLVRQVDGAGSVRRQAGPQATHGPRALYLGRRRASGTASLWLY